MPRYLWIALLVAAPMPAWAQAAPPSTADTRPDAVWGNVAFDMPLEAVRALYPEGKGVKYHRDNTIEIHDVPIIGKCKAEVRIYFEAGVVSKIVVAGDPSLGGRCSDQVLSGLSSKYGEPLNRDEYQGSILAREGKVFVWNRPGGVTMRFKKFTSGAFGGGGLGSASWELTYTKVGSDLTL